MFRPDDEKLEAARPFDCFELLIKVFSSSSWTFLKICFLPHAYPMKTTFSYCAYGLEIDSELPLPELLASPGYSDTWIRFGKVGWPGPIGANRLYNFLVDGNSIYLSWQEAGQFLIREGREIIVDPLPGIDEAIIRLHLPGILGVLLYQRGVLTIHASVVAINNESAVAFLGDKGWGKSTLAAALHTQGHGFLSDDLLVVDFEPGGLAKVRPGFPQLKLWPDTVHSLGGDATRLSRLHPAFEKRASPVTRNFACNSFPLQSLYVLSHGTSPGIQAIPAQSALTEVVRHSQATRFLREQGNIPRHFLQCAKLINEVPLYQLRRPNNLNLVSDLCTLIEEHYQTAALSSRSPMTSVHPSADLVSR